MTQNVFGGVTTFSLPLLDANFTECYRLVNACNFTAGGVVASMVYARASDGSIAGLVGGRTGSAINIFNNGGVTAELVVENGYVSTWVAGNERLRVDNAGTARPGADNTQTLGAASYRWSTVYAGAGTINTSDAREKTAVQPLSAAEIAAAKQLAGELGSFRFLAAVAAKGQAARVHIGMTVQRAIEILASHGLDPMAYAFICHDTWPAEAVPARTGQRATGLSDDRGQPLFEVVELEPARTIPAGDRYGFRVDELLLFLARGFDARLQALEAAA